MTFVSEKISVSFSEEGSPQGFSWRGQSYQIVKVERRWQEYGLPASGTPKRQSWLFRRHRNYYRVMIADGRRFDIYMDRRSMEANKKWILHQKLLAS